MATSSSTLEQTPFPASAATPSFFVLRVPVLPVEAIRHETETGSLKRALLNTADPIKSELLIKEDRARTHSRLLRVLSNTFVRDALELATPTFLNAVESSGIDFNGGPSGRRDITLNRYVTRMAARATPFGLFAGYAIGTIGDDCRLDLSNTIWRRVARLDPKVIAQLCDLVTAERRLPSGLRVQPNSSLHRVREKWRYTQRVSASDTGTCVVVDAVDSPELSDAIDASTGGATIGAIVDALLRAVPDADDEVRSQAQGYVRELIDSGILEAESIWPTTGPEPLAALVGTAIAHGAESLAVSLQTVSQLLSTADAQPLTISAAYADVDRYVRTLVPANGVTCHVQLIRDADVSLTPMVSAEVYRGALILHDCSRRLDDEEQRRIVERFMNRFGDREVPVLEALDPDTGIEFGMSLRARSDMSTRLRLAVTDEPTRPRLGAREEVLLDLMYEEGSSTSGRLELTPERTARISAPQNRRALPDAFSALACVAAASAADVREGRFSVLLKSFIGPSGARLLGRFCHSDSELTRHVREHLEIEESASPETIFAEIVHLPATGMGALVCRPVLRRYEIPYLGRSGAPAERQIPLTDLLLSVRDGRFHLRSSRLNRRVIPRLTSAHNYLLAENLPVYRFLCWLQDHDVRSTATWDWGALERLDHLPRVSSGRCVLSREKWVVAPREIQRWPPRISGKDFLDVQRWRERRGLPRTVLLVEGDKELPIDLESVLGIETFLHTARRWPRAVLFEAYPGESEQCVRDHGAGYVHEVVIPFSRPVIQTPAPSVTLTRERSNARVSVPSSFIPGSEWLFVKLFTGKELVDELVTGYIRPLVNATLRAGAMDHWHFLRYDDPSWHLRVRFHGSPETLTGVVLPELHSAVATAVKRKLVWQYQLDTYVRETQRYGGHQAIPVAEEIFWADSEAAADVLAHMCATRDENVRLLVALYSVDRLMSDFGLTLDDKAGFTHSRRRELDGWLRVDLPAKRRLGENYRRLRTAIVEAVERGQSPFAGGNSLSAFARRASRVVSCVAQLKCYEAGGELTEPVRALLPHFVHMSLNRLWTHPSLADELAVYDLLCRHYEHVARRC